VLAWAVRYGRAAGVSAALVLSVCDFALNRWTFSNIDPNGEVITLLAGFAVGHVVQLAADLETERQHADRIEAASRERERLARDIHDSVLQVLALVAKRGLEAGGEAAEIGRLAGQQEVALRALISAEGAPPREDAGYAGAPASRPVAASGVAAQPPGDATDLRALLRPLATESMTVGTPAGPVLVRREAGEEIAAAVRAALDNVRRHCGAQARAWVLVEDEPDVVTVTIRDDGPGIPPGRLARAAAAGRLGVSQSIFGRLRDLGGSAEVSSVPGEGTEVTLRLPRAAVPVKVRT
jgi:signal transduction histidine kinase